MPRRLSGFTPDNDVFRKDLMEIAAIACDLKVIIVKNGNTT